MAKKDIDFIARHYRNGRFSPDTGWHSLGIAPVSHWARFRVAVAIAATVALSATAAIIYHEHYAADAPQETVTVHPVTPLAEVKVIDFENAPLAEVVKKIETVYNVRVENLPADPGDYNLSLHYEGTPADLIAVINDILETQMTVTER